VYLGEYNSPGSRRGYARIVAELAVNPDPPPPPSYGDARPDGVTVNEVLPASVKRAEQHYRGPDGKRTGELHHVKAVCRTRSAET
jgi:hypothetical protein